MGWGSASLSLHWRHELMMLMLSVQFADWRAVATTLKM
jgi:hypothetical protein